MDNHSLDKSVYLDHLLISLSYQTATLFTDLQALLVLQSNPLKASMEQQPLSQSLSLWVALAESADEKEGKRHRDWPLPQQNTKQPFSSINNILMHIQIGSTSLSKGLHGHLRVAELKALYTNQKKHGKRFKHRPTVYEQHANHFQVITLIQTQMQIQIFEKCENKNLINLHLYRH